MKVFLPTVGDMFADLKNHGIFTHNFIPTNPTQPLPQLQPTISNYHDDQNLIHEVSISGKTQLDYVAWHKIIHNLSKLVTLALGGQFIFNMYKSIKFMMVDYPALENQLQSGLLETPDINRLASREILLTMTTVFGLLVAFSINYFKKPALKLLGVVVGVSLFLGNAYILNYLSQLSSGAIIGDELAQVFYQIQIFFMDLFR